MLVETTPDSSQILLSHISSDPPNHAGQRSREQPFHELFLTISRLRPAQPGLPGSARLARFSAGNDLSDIGSDPQELTRAGSHDDGS